MATKEYPAGKRGLPPSHPGRIWRGVIKDGLEITISEAADRMNVSRQQLHRVLGGENPVTPNFALRFARLCNKKAEDAELWLRIQMEYDLWHAKEELKQALRAVRPVKTKARELVEA